MITYQNYVWNCRGSCCIDSHLKQHIQCACYRYTVRSFVLKILMKFIFLELKLRSKIYM